MPHLHCRPGSNRSLACKIPSFFLRCYALTNQNRCVRHMPAPHRTSLQGRRACRLAGRRLPAGPRTGPQPMRIFSPILSFLNSKVTAYTNAAVSPSVCGRPPMGMLCFAARGLARLSGFSKRPSARPAPAGPPLCCIPSFASPLVNVYIFTLFLSFFQPASINSILLMFCPNRTILFSSPVHRGRRNGAPFPQ